MDNDQRQEKEFAKPPACAWFCLCRDPFFTFAKISDPFIKMFGYTESQIAVQFQGRFLSMIHPMDKDSFQKEMESQLAKGGVAKHVHRITRADGNTLWVMTQAQLSKQNELYCFITDVTAETNVRQELQRSLAHYRILLNETSDIIFEWNSQSDLLTFSQNWQTLFGYPLSFSECSQKHLKNLYQKIHPDDEEQLHYLIDRVLASQESYTEVQLRIQNSAGKYLWCRVRVSAQWTELKKELWCVGSLVNIDAEKRLTQNLQKRAERDSLTGLYNRMTTQSLVESYLYSCEPNARGALLIIDIDDFKQVNDSWGHLFGDAVLSEFASDLKKLFRSSDLLGRVGGDEFIVFLKNISPEVAVKKARQLLSLHNQDGAAGGYRFSCSIGISLYPKDGKNFEELYHHADIGLYRAKRLGKHRCMLYEQEGVLSAAENEPPVSSVNETIDSNKHNAGLLRSQLAEYVFQTLYRSSDLQAAVNLILKIVGQQFHVSRAYIFENTEDNAYMCNTFEWCNDGVSSEQENLRKVPYGDLSGFEERFDENGIFYCRDVKELSPQQAAFFAKQGILSMLLCAIWDKGVFRGFVGFDDCSEHRLWTQQQIDALMLISKMLSTFLLKQRAQEKIERSARQLKAVLDHQNLWIYVVDKETRRLVYFNHRVRESLPALKQNAPCYAVFFQHDAPCKDCPLQALLDDERRTIELYSPVFQAWLKIDVAPIQWDGRAAYMLTCCDITPYKGSAPSC